MSNVTKYSFNGHDIRVIEDGDGSEWFCTKDMIRALELEDSATTWWLWLECDEKHNKSFIGPDGRQYLRVVNRAGVRKMLKKSKVSDDFKRWAAAELKEKKSNHEKIESVTDDHLLTPTKIGHAIGGLSAQDVNQLLVNLGMQRPVMDFDKKRYLLTDVGEVLGIIKQIKKSNDEEVTSVLWREPIIKLVAARHRAEKRNFHNA